MVTLKKDNCSYVVLVIVTVFVFWNSYEAVADETTTIKLLVDSYKLPEELTEEMVERVVSELEHSIKGCRSDKLIFRTKYRMGILYFKANCLDKAQSAFNWILKDRDCPELIRMCSLNMKGQISRMTAKDKEALKAFSDLLELSEKHLLDGSDRNISTVLKLFCGAVFARAEIYEFQRDCHAAIAEYTKIFDICRKEHRGSYDNCIALAIDRISQLSLMLGNFEKYFGMTRGLTAYYSKYCRTPTVQFEIEAVKFLKRVNPKSKFPRGSFDAPARLITFLKNNKDNNQLLKITATLEDLCRKYDGTYGGTLLDYHYAWLLDAIGEKGKEIEVLAEINKNDEKNIGTEDNVQIVSKVIAEYAKVQQSILLGERGEYNRALEAIRSIKSDLNNLHLSNLIESVEKGLETLKREVPKDEKVH